MANKQNQPIIQLYSNDEMKMPISPLLDFAQLIPTKNKKFITDDNSHLVAYGIGKYNVDTSTLRTLDYNNIDAFKLQLETSKYYPLSILCDTQGYMYSVIPDGTFATEDYVKTYVNGIVVDGEVDLSNYATITYVDDAIADALKEPTTDKNVEALTIFAYCGSETSLPSTPEGGYWQKTDNEEIVITYPDGWGSLDSVTVYPIYMSTSIQMQNGKFITNWTTPILVSGPEGKPGEDAPMVEFKYLLTQNNNVPEGPGTETSPEWTNNPSGISSEYPYEWIVSKNQDDDNWSIPVLWSRWGVDGKDGSDIQFIYFRNNGGTVENPTPDDALQNTDYQNDAYCPDDWTPNPQGINNEFTHEWVCSRKKINGFWQPFSNPASWAIIGENGESGYNIRTLYKAVSHDKTGSELSEEVDIFRNNDDLSLATSNGWNIIMPVNYNSDEWVWSISAYVTSDNKLIKVKDENGDEIGWQGPILVTGKGKDGESVDGNGLTGIPGVDFVIKYCRGIIGDNPNSEDTEDNWLDVEDVNDFDSSGWVDDVNEIYKNIDASFPYIYCVQGRKVYSRKGNTNEFDWIVEWGTPFRLSGTNGLNGSTGKNGQIIYPAGVYNIDKEYVLDDMKAPYVLDTNDKNYYVLNVERWKGTEQNDNMPSTDNTGAWTKFEQFEAIYADIGMFRSALVGSAVFNGDYMFSQNGLDTSGNLSNNYENFDKNDPYGDNATFKPTFCVNLRTGQMWLSNGNVMFNSDGSGELAGGQIHWTADGVLVLPQVIVFNGFYDFDDLSITALKYSLDIENANIDESAKVNIELLKSDGTIYKTLDITDEILNDQHVSGIIQMGDILYDDIPIKMQLKINNEVIKTIALNVPDIIYKRLNVSIDDSSFKTPSSWGLTVQPITYKFNSDDIVYGKIKKINDYTFNIDGTINDVSTNMSFSLRSTAPYRNDVSIISSNCDVDKTSFDFDTDDSSTSGTINISNIKNGANVTFKPVFNMNNVVKDASIKRLGWQSTAVNDNILIGPFNCVPADASVAEIILHSNTSDSTFSSAYSVYSSNDLTGKITYLSSSRINLDALDNSYTNEDGYINCSIKLSDSNNNVLIDMDNVLIPKVNIEA